MDNVYIMSNIIANDLSHTPSCSPALLGLIDRALVSPPDFCVAPVAPCGRVEALLVRRSPAASCHG